MFITNSQEILKQIIADINIGILIGLISSIAIVVLRKQKLE